LINTRPSIPMRILALFLPLLATVTACAPFPPGTEGTGAYANQTSTGSNIAHKTTDVQSVDKDALADRTRFGTAGAPTGPGH
jgi:hypothetical protein